MSCRPCLRSLLATAAVSLAFGGMTAQAQQTQPAAAAASRDVLYGALVLATKSEHPQPPPEALKTQADNLQKIFGYNEFHLLGEKKKAINTGQEDWLVPSRQFILRVDTKNQIIDGYALALQLLEEDRVIVEANVKLKHDHPLFIRGPFVGDGQILILLTVL